MGVYMILYIIIMGIFVFVCFRQYQSIPAIPQNTTIRQLLHQMEKIAFCSGILMTIAFFWRIFLKQDPKILTIGSILIYSVGLVYTMLKLYHLQKNRKED